MLDGRALNANRPARFAVLAVCAVAGLAYLRWAPPVPDLAAQVARTKLVHDFGVTTWWTGWFGGLSMPEYSLIAPWLMTVIGVRGAGVLSLIVGTVAMTRLAEGSLRPRAAAAAFAASLGANLVMGRVTFGLGLAVGAWALVALRSRLAPALLGLSVLTFLVSPLAGLFLGIALSAVWIVDPSRRRLAAGAAGVLLALGLTSAIFFPGGGRMPFRWTDLVPSGLSTLGVAVACRERAVRVCAVLTLVALVGMLAVPGAVGTNMTRLTWMCAAPLVVAYCPVRKPALALFTALLVIWPATDLVGQLTSAASPSSAQRFYTPLASALANEQARPGTVGLRLEVVDSSDHWAAAYLAQDVPLARGWYRQADAADNPIFYDDDALTAQSYHQWLRELAVGWVAVPNVTYDYAAVAEAKLIAGGLPYLQVAWASSTWTLYRVSDPAPLAIGATVVGTDQAGVVLRSTGPAEVDLRVRWSPYLSVQDEAGKLVSGACLTGQNGWTLLHLPAAGTYRVGGAFDPVARFDSTQRCTPTKLGRVPVTQ